MSETRTFTINHSLNKAPESPESAAARKQREETAKQVRARRKQIHDQAKIDVSGSGIDNRPDPIAAPIREDIETIEIPLRDGRVVVYGPPSGVSLQDRIVRMYSGRPIAEGGPDPGLTEYRMTRVLMGVRSIDGRPVTCNDLIQRTKLANTLGDEAIDLLHYFDRVNWPPLTEAELPIVKKNYRTQHSAE